MSYSRIHTVLGLEKTLVVGLVLAAGLGGCKKPAPTDAAPSASGSAAAVAPAGPCGEYANKLCDKAGLQSSACQTARSAGDFLPPQACSTALTNIDYSFKKLEAMKGACDELAKKACAAVGEKTKTCQMVQTQTKQFPPDRCKEMLQHMPEVTAELKRMEDSNKPLSKELQTELVQGPVASFGPADAKVQIVEFSDFQCPYCSRAAEVVHKIKEKYGDKVHFMFRQYPLPMHPNARIAAEAALAANKEGKFWEFHDKLFKNQQQLDRGGLEQHAKEAGLNLASFKKSLDSHEFGATVDSDMKLGEKVHVSGTPTLFINGERVQDPTNYDAVAEAIETALKGGTPG